MNPILNNKNKFNFCIYQPGNAIDVLQTYIACKEFSKQNENIKLSLILKEEIFTALDFLDLSFFEKIFKVQNENEPTLLGSIDIKFDVLLNLGFDVISSKFIKKINSKNYLGLQFDLDHGLYSRDPWGQYVLSLKNNNANMHFNFVDFVKGMLGNSFNLKTKLNIAKNPSIIKSVQFFITDHQGRNNLKIHRWFEICDMLLREDPLIHIKLNISSELKEQCLKHAETYNLNKYQHSFEINIIPKDLKNVLQTIKPDDFIIFQDVLFGHLGSLVNARTLWVATGSNDVVSLSPYHSESFVLTSSINCFPCNPQKDCQIFLCQNDINSRSLTSMIKNISNNESKDNIYKSIETGMTLNTTTINNNNFLELENYTNFSISSDQAIQSIFQVIWSLQLFNLDLKKKTPRLNNDELKKITKYKSAVASLFSVYEFGKQYSKFILDEVNSETPNITNIKKFSSKIDEADLLANEIAHSFPSLSMFIYFNKTERAFMDGSNLVSMANNSLLSYHKSSVMSSALHELIDKILNDGKLTTPSKNFNEI